MIPLFYKFTHLLRIGNVCKNWILHCITLLYMICTAHCLENLTLIKWDQWVWMTVSLWKAALWRLKMSVYRIIMLLTISHILVLLLWSVDSFSWWNPYLKKKCGQLLCLEVFWCTITGNIPLFCCIWLERDPYPSGSVVTNFNTWYFGNWRWNCILFIYGA